jgi:transposase
MRSSYDKSLEAIGRSVGGLSTKIHAKVDSLGQLVNILLTPGQVHESQVAQEVFADEECEFFLADKAYDMDAFRENLNKKGIQPVLFRMTSITDAVCCNTSLFQKRNILKPCAFNQSLRFLSYI